MLVIRSDQNAWDEEVDVVVAGGGGAGLTAALAVAIEGFRPLICEKSSRVGGTTARSSGGIWVPGSHQAERSGRPDSLDQARAYLAAFLGGATAARRCDAYLAAGPEILDYLERNSDVRFVPFDAYPDYRDHPGATIAGHALFAAPFDGRLLGRDFHLVAPPLASLTVLGGMMISRADIPHLVRPFGSLRSLLHVGRLVGRHLADRLSYDRGTRLLMGNALVARLLFSLKKRNVPIWTNTRAVNLVRTEGRVVGAIVEKEGRRIRVSAKYGVILASGGFSHSDRWRKELMSPAEARALSLAYEANEGDGLSLAADVGAHIARGSLRNAAVWVPVSIYRPRRGAEVKFPHFFLDRPKPGFIAVSHMGRRFVNEAASYHDFVAGMLSSADVMNSLPTYLICDASALKRYGIGIIPPGRRWWRKFVKAGYLTLAPSIDQLAHKLGVDPVHLRETIDRNNRFAELGVDQDFGKGSSDFNRFHGDPSRTGSPCLGPISDPPFAAVALWPGELSTYAGIWTDEHGQAADARGTPIPGLHVCGNDLASIFEGEAPGPGVTLGPALVFAVIAARHALRSPAALSVAVPSESSIDA